MLSIILKILSILGIILLVLLGIILILLLLVLFFPVFYRVKAEKHSASTDDMLESSEKTPLKQPVFADAKVWWFFGLLRARYKYPEPGALKVKFLFFILYDSGADTDISSNTNSTDKDFDYADKSDLQKTDSAKSETNTKTTSTVNTEENGVSGQPATEDRSLPEEANYLDEEELSASQNKKIFEKIQYTIQNFCDKIKKAFAKLKEVKENIAYYKEVFAEEDTKELLKHALKRLGRILKSLRPRKLRANILFGAASPDTTGYVCAIYGMTSPHIGKHVMFTPDFEQEIFEGDLYAAGHTTVFLILWNLLMLVKDKKLWKLRDKLNRKPN